MTPDAEWVKCSVVDSGPGIPADEAAKIFDKFYQVEQSNKQKAKGTGLGFGHIQGVSGYARGQNLDREPNRRGKLFFLYLARQATFGKLAMEEGCDGNESSGGR